MSVVVLLARLVLALIFVVAGLAKLADLKGSQQALRDFGVLGVLARPMSVLLPLAELVVAVALLLPLSAWWGGLGALILLLLFVAGIGSNLARGRHPDCHCFGQLHSAPAGWPTLIRNLVLAAVAAVVVVFGWSLPEPGVFDWLAPFSLSQRVEMLVGLMVLVLLLAGGWLLLQVLSQQGRLLLRIEALEAQLAASGMAPQSMASGQAASPMVGLSVGGPAPSFALPTLSGETMTLQALRGLGKPVVVLFSDPGCGPCNALLPEIGRWQREQATKLVVALISRGTAEANRPKVTEYGLTHVLLQKDREVAQAYQANGTPSAVLIRRDGTIGSPLAQGADAIRALIVTALSPAGQGTLPMAAAQGNGNGAAPRLPVSPKVGEVAPDFSLPDLAGQTVHLSDFRSDRTLLLFWRPSCGFCQRMLPDLKAWEANPPQGAPKLLVVSTGSVEENQALGLRSPVVLDPDGMGVGRLFGASGTPNAVLVDGEGKLASEVAVGAPAVLALAGVQVPAAAQGSAVAPRVLPPPQIGEPAPAFSLPNLSGKRVHLSDFRGSPTLVLFWNPGCGFCQRMLSDLQAWEAHPPKDAPKLLVVSTGSVEANRALGLRSSLVLDQQMSVGSTFGATGTPKAVLVDAQGKLASELAVGASAVLALAGADTERSISRPV